MRRTALLGCVAGLTLLLEARGAHAEGCPVSPEIGPAPGVASVEPRERLSFIDQSMAGGVGAARRHTWGWAGLQAASMVGNGVLFFVVSDEARPDRAVGFTTATVGLAATLIVYPALLRNHEAVARLAAPDAVGPECARVVEAERLLVATAQHETSSRSWFRHFLNVAFNGAMAVVLGVGYERWSAAAMQAVPLAIGEAILFTRPTTAIEALARYRAGELSRASALPARGSFDVVMVPTPLGFGGTF